MTESTTPEKQDLSFDSDFSPEAEINRRAAQSHNLRFNSRTRQYVDEDGCPVRNEFGQPF